MSMKAKIFPFGTGLIIVACLGLGCGAAGAPIQEPPCERDCANGFVTCLEDCGDDGQCRDECMAERSSCSQACGEPPAPPADAGA